MTIKQRVEAYFGRPTFIAWMASVFFYSGLLSLVQDWYGLEGYIQHLREHWVSGKITVPIAAVCIAIGATLDSLATDREKARTASACSVCATKKE